MNIQPPSLTEIKKAASDLYFDMDESEISEYSEFMDGLIAGVNLVESLDEPKLPTKYPRGELIRPAEKENRYNAWFWKCSIKGKSEGKLAGKSVVIKDNICVAGVPMMNGSNVFEGLIPDQDATVVTRVLDEGGEILGKAVCENFCFSGGSHTSATGPVLNPHNIAYMAGGSSSGCAALIVSGECDMGIGSDQGGSVRMPASFSGCFGIKPTYGLVPYTGASGIDQSVDHLGPMAASTKDCALLLEVIAGFDEGRDPRQKNPITKKYSELYQKGVKGMRIGLVEESFAMPGHEEDVSDLVRETAHNLGGQGAIINRISIPEHEYAGAIMLVSILDGTLSTFTEQGPNGPNFQGHSMTEAIKFYYSARREKANLMPVTVKNFLLFAKIMRERYGNYYSAKAQNQVRNISKIYDKALGEQDLLLMPTTPMKAHKLPDKNATNGEILGCALDMLGNTSPFDATGHPSMSVPIGKSEGLPVGLMLTGKRTEDDLVLRGSQAIEELLAS